MRLQQGVFCGAADLTAMAALARAFPSRHVHVVDLPYRFSSWALDTADNVGLWFGDDDRLLGWAVTQTPFWTVDAAVHPEADPTLYREILAWADRRARATLSTPFGHPSWFVGVFADQADLIRELEAAGYACQADVGANAWSQVLLQRPADLPEPACRVPPGFVLRPLAGESEVEAYVEVHRAVFESKAMTPAWRARTLRSPGYVRDLDLVAVAPDGQVAAFCIGWLAASVGGGFEGQIEPLGVHPAFRGVGLGRAILVEAVRRLRQRGAASVLVETDTDRDAALALYEAVSFRRVRDILVYRKDFA